MVTQVYLWTADKMTGVFDHASLGLSDNTYISWWGHIKEFSVRNLRKNGTAKSVTDDIFVQSGRYPNTLTLVDIDEDKVNQWWTNFRNRKEPAYDGEEINSITVVFKALCEGEEFFQNKMATCLSSKELEDVVKQYVTDRELKDKTIPFQKFVWFNVNVNLPKLGIRNRLQSIMARLPGKSKEGIV